MLELALYDDGATWAQLAGLLDQPVVQGFSEIKLFTKKFVALRDVSSFATEFSLRIEGFNNGAFAEMPDVNDVTDRRKRFRYQCQGEDIVVRVHVYANQAARERLTVMTIDRLGRTVFFLRGDVSLPDLKWLPACLSLYRFY